MADPAFDARVAQPAYTKKRPRVLFDEAHNNFHTAAGRYKPFAELIANDGYLLKTNRKQFTKEALDGYDILVIANAQGDDDMDDEKAFEPAFTEAECDAVHDWVRGSGSLLLIADHAPFGVAAEILAKRFEVEMSKGYTVDSSNYDQESGNKGFILYTRDNQLLADHHITQGRDATERVNRVMSFTGQSLKGPEGSVAFLKLADTAQDISPATQQTASAAGRAQAIAMKFGKGRVIVLGEAGMLSAQVVGPERRPFGMNHPGIDNRQLALNIMHWLSGLLK
jgi:hypothetical protein